MVWDDNSIKLLKKLWEKGLSTTEIAKKMNISKNSVVGKVHRLCLKARPSPIKKKEEEILENTEEKTVKKTNKKTKKEIDTAKNSTSEVADLQEMTVNADASEKIEEIKPNNTPKTETKNNPSPKNLKNIKLVELDSHTCRWPIGDPRDEDFCFCGKKVRAGQTYCDEHSQIAYVKALTKK